MESKFSKTELLKQFLYIGVVVGLLLSFYFIKRNDIGTDGITKISDVNEDSGVEIVDSNVYTFERVYDFEVEELVKKSEGVLVEDYIVKKGDTLYGISKLTNQDFDVLIANNPKVKNGKLRIGQVIKILSKNGIYYKVKKGDNLIKIAKRYNVKTDKLIDDNKLKDTKLLIGQELFILEPDMKYVKRTASRKGNSVDFGWPIKWRGVTSPFGTRFHPVLKRYIMHKGVDLKAGVGVPVYAPKDGKVTFAGYMRGYGKLIKLKHSKGYSTRFAHLSKISVKNGEYVEKGELIGKTGKTGRVTGPHLHYEIRKRGKPLNPMKFRK